MTQLAGVFGPLITTFYDETGELDVASFAANVRAHIAAGLHGVVVTGSTGEAALLDARERAALVDAAREVVPSDRQLIVGTGAESTRTTLHQTRDAASRGADAVLVVAPHYYTASMTAPALLQHFTRIADESPVPVILYSIPKYMHFPIPPAVVAELATHENVVGIKDSSGDRALLTSYIESQSETFSVVVGNGGLIQFMMESGGRGAIVAVGLFAPSLALEVYDAMVRGDPETASAAQARLAPLHAKIVAELGPAGIKVALDRMGLAGGTVRSPLMGLTDEQREAVEELLKASELVGV